MEQKKEDVWQKEAREAEKKYGDLLRYEYRGPKKHPHMSAEARAAQFSPFAALTGYEEAVKETGRLTEEKPELDEERKAEIDRVLQLLVEMSRTGDVSDGKIRIRVTYFQPDQRKAGGALVDVEGFFRRIDGYRKRLFIEGENPAENPSEISLEEITDLVVV